jgi:hypothetical protein
MKFQKNRRENERDNERRRRISEFLSRIRAKYKYVSLSRSRTHGRHLESFGLACSVLRHLHSTKVYRDKIPAIDVKGYVKPVMCVCVLCWALAAATRQRGLSSIKLWCKRVKQSKHRRIEWRKSRVPKYCTELRRRNSRVSVCVCHAFVLPPYAVISIYRMWRALKMEKKKSCHNVWEFVTELLLVSYPAKSSSSLSWTDAPQCSSGEKCAGCRLIQYTIDLSANY